MGPGASGDIRCSKSGAEQSEDNDIPTLPSGYGSSPKSDCCWSASGVIPESPISSMFSSPSPSAVVVGLGGTVGPIIDGIRILCKSEGASFDDAENDDENLKEAKVSGCEGIAESTRAPSTSMGWLESSSSKPLSE